MSVVSDGSGGQARREPNGHNVVPSGCIWLRGAGNQPKSQGACERGFRAAVTSVEYSDDFAARLSLALQACNLSRAQLSSLLGVHKSMVSRWLSGEMKPTGYNLARISAALARANPGFNMTLWTAPRAEFEAALGLSSSGSASLADVKREASVS